MASTADRSSPWRECPRRCTTRSSTSASTCGSSSRASSRPAFRQRRELRDRRCAIRRARASVGDRSRQAHRRRRGTRAGERRRGHRRRDREHRAAAALAGRRRRIDGACGAFDDGRRGLRGCDARSPRPHVVSPSTLTPRPARLRSTRTPTIPRSRRAGHSRAGRMPAPRSGCSSRLAATKGHQIPTPIAMRSRAARRGDGSRSREARPRRALSLRLVGRRAARRRGAARCAGAEGARAQAGDRARSLIRRPSSLPTRT